MILPPKKWDIAENSKELIKMAHAFLSGREIINIYRKKDPRKKVVALNFPISELIYATGAIPLNLLRYEKFRYNGTDKVLEGITRITKLFGWKSLDAIIKLAFFTRAGGEIVEFLVDNMVLSINERYETLTKLGEMSGFPADTCFGSRMLYGLAVNSGKYVDASFGFGYRCPFTYKFFESFKSHMKNNYIVDIPNTTGKHAESALESDLMEFIQFLEGLTGNRFSETKLAETVDMSNELKHLYKEFLFVTCKNEILPYNPLTFSQLQALLMFSFIDFNSNIKAYRKNIKNLIAEMETKIERGKGHDVSNKLKILYTPVTTGLEYDNLRLISELGGVPLFADWEIFGFLEPISSSNNVLKNFVRYLLNYNNFMGSGNDRLAESMVRVAKDMGCDGALYQDVFACRNIGPTMKYFKDRARNEGMPVLETTLNNIGENLEQTRTRIEAFMEMLHE
ncbi:MAG: 2-hydroxyacyl-CoA dehydratase family protein [Candidatus Hodarchaeota archaeon]